MKLKTTPMDNSIKTLKRFDGEEYLCKKCKDTGSYMIAISSPSWPVFPPNDRASVRCECTRRNNCLRSSHEQGKGD